MSDSRERFEAWAKAPPREFDTMIQTAEGPWPGQYDDYIAQCAWEAWQAAEAETARRCVEWIDAFSIAGDRAEHMKHGINGAFPEAWK